VSFFRVSPETVQRALPFNVLVEECEIFCSDFFSSFCIAWYLSFFHVCRGMVADYGLQLGEVAALEAQIFNFAQKFNRITAVELCSFAPLLQNPCVCPAKVHQRWERIKASHSL